LDEVEPGHPDGRFKIGNLKNGDLVTPSLKPSAERGQRIEVASSRKAQEAQMTHVVYCSPG
jgi:hypothetical protein